MEYRNGCIKKIILHALLMLLIFEGCASVIEKSVYLKLLSCECQYEASIASEMSLRCLSGNKHAFLAPRLPRDGSMREWPIMSVTWIQIPSIKYMKRSTFESINWSSTYLISWIKIDWPTWEFRLWSGFGSNVEPNVQIAKNYCHL